LAYKVAIVAGTRPEIIKLAPVMRALRHYPEMELLFFLSGQHYDFEMVDTFINELGLPPPIENLKVGSGTHAQQMANLLIKCEDVIQRYKPNIVVAQGDTNTVAASGLAAVKLHVPFGHVEAGLRSYDRRMPEEINRMIARVCAELHFAPTSRAAINLLYEGVPPNKVFITGNTIVDACLQHLEMAKEKSVILNDLSIDGDTPLLTVTVHRPDNVDNREPLQEIVNSLLELEEFQIVFPIHPRTFKMLKKFDLHKDLQHTKHVTVSKPLGYLDFLRMLSASDIILTDSGGVQEEAATLKIPCLTIRHSTERPETLEGGGNRLVGVNKGLIVHHARELLKNDFKEKWAVLNNPFGDGRAGERIARILVEKCREGICVDSPDFYEAGSATFKLVKAEVNLAGKTIRGLQNENPSLLVTLIYDEDGQPLVPYPELVVKKGWFLRIFGQNPNIPCPK